MNTVQIEADIFVQATIDRVWQAVSRPDQLNGWFTDGAEFDLRPGGDGVLSWEGKATHQPIELGITVTAVEAPGLFSYRWHHPADEPASEGNSLLVEFSLTAEGDFTRVRVTEYGLSEIDWPEDQRAQYAEQNKKGWEMHLHSLSGYVASESAA